MPANTKPTAPKPPAPPKRPKPLRAQKASTGLEETLAWSRLAFGPTALELVAYRAAASGDRPRFEAFVEAQLHPDQLKDEACDTRLHSLKLATQGKPLAQLWQDHAVAANKLKDMAKAKGEGRGDKADKDAENDLRQRPLRETEIATWVRAVYSRRQLNEVLVDHWHNHFNVFGPDGQVAPGFPHYDRDVIRSGVLGNFREFLGKVAQAPAMLFYLDNNVNQSGNPNENYARELFELHTLGSGSYLGTMPREKVSGFAAGEPLGYVDGDVYEAARCFTGWRVDSGGKSGETGAFQYFDQWHDRFQKIILGRPIPEHQPPLADGLQVLDRLAAHPGTARHVARRLCVRLVGDAPSEALVAAAAAVFRAKAQDPDQLRGVVRAIVLSAEFTATVRQKLRRPFEVTVAALRATGAEFSPTDEFCKEAGKSGQRLFQWRTPDGYPDRREAWGSTNSMLERWRFANQLAAGTLPGTTFDPVAATPATCISPAQVADFWLPRLLHRPSEARTRAALVTLLAQGRNPAAPLTESQRHERIGPAVALALMAPEFQWR